MKKAIDCLGPRSPTQKPRMIVPLRGVRVEGCRGLGLISEYSLVMVRSIIIPFILFMHIVYCRNLIRKPWSLSPQFFLGLIRFLYHTKSLIINPKPYTLNPKP